MFDDALIIRRAAQIEGHPEELAQRVLALMTGPADESRGARNRRLLEQEAIQHHLVVEFGRRHGWRLSASRFSLACLAKRGHHDAGGAGLELDEDTADHPIFYRTPDRRAAAIAANIYNSGSEERRQQLCAWAEQQRLTASFPSFPSWWFPGWTTLVLYQPQK